MVLVVCGVPVESDTFTFLDGVGQTCVFFFPILVGMSTARYFGMDTFLGGVIAGAMCYPVINNPELAGTTARLFGVLPIPYLAYTSSVFPALAVWAKSKNPDTRSLALSTAITNLFGISEPGLYGVILQHKETLLALGIGSGIAGIIPAFFHTTVYSLGASGIFGLPMYLSPDGSLTSFIGAVITQVVAAVVCFLLTYFWPGFDPDQA